MRVLFVLASVCSLSLAACGDSAAPSPSSASAATASIAPTQSAAVTQTVRSQPATETAPNMNYVALGDSYTIGTSVKPRERWPNQLVRTLNPQTGLTLVDNLAVNGASTQDVIDHQIGQLASLDPGFLSLLIGVNDVVRGADLDTYRDNLRIIFQAMLAEVPANRILLVTTPDYTLTPQGAAYGDPARQSALIRIFNAALDKEAAQFQLLVVDISQVSNQVPNDPTLVADDGLHPSGKQYAAWVDLMAKAVRKLFNPGTAP